MGGRAGGEGGRGRGYFYGTHLSPLVTVQIPLEEKSRDRQKVITMLIHAVKSSDLTMISVRKTFINILCYFHQCTQ